MTPAATLLSRIGWTAPEMTRRLGMTRAQTWPWIVGKNTRGNAVEPPAAVVAWLERVALAVEREGVPK